MENNNKTKQQQQNKSKEALKSNAIKTSIGMVNPLTLPQGPQWNIKHNNAIKISICIVNPPPDLSEW